MTWQYNGVAGWSNIIDWCDQYLYNSYSTNGYETIIFHNPQAELLFRLRWS